MTYGLDGKKKDTVFAEFKSNPTFKFDHKVADAFDNMAKRSIPLYAESLELFSRLSNLCYQPSSWIVDLGCSTAEALCFLAPQSIHNQIQYLGIDNSHPMIEIARQKTLHLRSTNKLEFRCSDVSQEIFPDASIVACRYTLQFIDPTLREGILANIFNCLKPGGVLMLSEKNIFTNSFTQSLATDIYEDYKFNNGYSRQEIQRKKEALQGVLIPWTEEKYREILNKIGFDSVECVLRYHAFSTLVAWKK